MPFPCPRPVALITATAVLLPLLGFSAAAQDHAQSGALNDYPTAARAEYVFACMASNGQTQDALTRCACSIDAIAEILPWDGYVAAETVMRMRQGGGERAGLFRATPTSTAILAELRRAQAEAEILCF